MSLNTTTLSTQGTVSASGLGSTGSAKQKQQQDPSPNLRGSSTMITLAAGPDVVVAAIGSTAVTTTTITGPASTTTTAKLAAATSGETHYVPTTPTTTAAVTKATAPRTAAATNPTSGIVTATSARARTTAATTTMTTRATTIRRRHKVKEFNDEISCSLCAGYLVNATTIDYCGHSYCRSCIIRHWKNSKYCPKCGPNNKQISLSNLIIDERLKSLVYKLVPGLYHNELQRLLQFTGNEAADEAVIDPEEDYFSPVEPISLSLEYHPEALMDCDKEQIPPVRYLQCPAAVTIHHLKRFISSKFDINLENSRVGIEIIYEDKILPEDFSLMDIGYCYSWKRENPMKFFYRILVHSVCNNPNKVITGDSVLSEKADILEAKRAKQSNTVKESEKVEASKDLRRSQSEKPKPTELVRDEDDDDGDQDEEDGDDDDDYDDDDNETVIGEKYGRSKTTYTILKTRSVRGDQSENLSGCNNNNNNSPTSKDKKSDKNQKDSNKGSVKMTIIARKSNDVKVKQGKTKSKRSASPQKTEVSPSSDFKSLRSNDVRYSNDYSASLSSVATSEKQHKSKASPVKASQRTLTPKCDIFVSIPPQSGHRSSNSSDDSYENLSLAQLKTANKKTTPTVTLKQSVSLDESMLSKSKATKLDVPKLKITVPKIPASPKSRKFSIDEPTIGNQVDITTYAKNIGLKPINPPLEEKKEIKLKISPNHSPSSSLSSSSTSSPPSAADSGFIFIPELTTSSHKKRKKAKHSKEPKEPGSKRRKLHAEISSQPAEESLKLKVKITGNPKSYKAERKASSSSDDIVTLSPASSVNVTTSSNTAPASTTSFAVSPTTTTTQSKEKHSRAKHMVNIPNLNRTLSEASNNINHLMKDTPAVLVSQDAAKPPANKPTISTPSVSMLKPLSIASSIIACSKPSSMPTPKLLSPKLPSLQDSKLPASPPLPPSLFKPTSMTLQPVSTIIPRSPLPVSGQTRITNDNGPTGVGHPHRMAPTSRPANNFAVPNPPKILPQSAKLTPISSIASAANRQAQLKRSASLDGSPPILAKQQKLEQDRLTRKSPYAPFSSPIINSTVSTPPPGNGIRIQKAIPPISATTATVVKVPEPTYYTSTMANSYTREIQPKKQKPISLPPSSISVTKMPDIAPGKMIQSTSGLSITPKQLTPPIQQFPQQKPALEIVRISSNIPPIDQQKLTVTNNNTVKPTAPKTTRPPPPTIPLVKIKRSANQTSPAKPTVTTVSAPTQQQAVLSTNNKSSDSSASVNGITNKKSDQKGAESANEAASKMTTDDTGALDLSGKSSRSPSQDKSSPPQTPKSAGTNQTLDAQSLTAANLEEALNKLKQQMAQSPSASAVTTSAPTASSTSSSTMPKKSSELSLKDTTSLDSSIPSPSLNSSNLQNLKMLSESATNREKIAIAIKNRIPPILPKLNEINKIRQNPTVRQQNASVRNIPNPSALAFRSQQPIPKLASITKTPLVVSKTATSVSSSATVTVSTESVKLSEDTLVKSQSTATPISALTTQPEPSTIPKIPSPTTTSTAFTGVSKIISSKKNLHLEQLAASLNMRAAAAAVDSLSKSSNSTTPATSTHPSSSSSSSITTSTTVVASYAPVVATSNAAAISATTT